jgi:hypothetical protein
MGWACHCCNDIHARSLGKVQEASSKYWLARLWLPIPVICCGLCNVSHQWPRHLIPPIFLSHLTAASSQMGFVASNQRRCCGKYASKSHWSLENLLPAVQHLPERFIQFYGRASTYILIKPYHSVPKKECHLTKQ